MTKSERFYKELSRLEEGAKASGVFDARELQVRQTLARIYGLPVEDDRFPFFDLRNIDMGEVYTRPEAQPVL